MDNPLNVLLIGASGKLGKAIEEVAKDLPTFHIMERATRSSPELHGLSSVDVVLDVSTAEALQDHLPKIVAAKKPLVIGTTGHSKKNLEAIEEASKKIPILLSPNFARGMSMIKHMLKLLPPEAKAKIQESHHTEKKDAPSGTAKELARLTRTAEREIIAKREAGIIGEHSLQLEFDDEKIEIFHEVLSRKPFARGALFACSYLSNKPKGLYTSFYDQD